MLQCQDCEFFHRDERGHVMLTCDPFATIKEPECLAKWHFLKTNQMVQAYQATLDFYQRVAPMQEKMFKVIEREVDDLNESEKWKADDDDDDNDDEWKSPSY